jgi:hypothetical protein
LYIGVVVVVVERSQVAVEVVCESKGGRETERKRANRKTTRFEILP